MILRECNMELFNIIAGLASILSLIISFVTYQKVKVINKTVSGNIFQNNNINQRTNAEVNQGVVNQVGIVGRDHK